MQEDSDGDEEYRQKPRCFNCGIPCHVTHATPKGQMCGTCHQYFNRTGRVRPTTGPTRKDGSRSRHSSLFRNSNRPPRGMYVNHDDLVGLATGPASQGEALLKSMDREIISYKRLVQNNKQYLSLLHRRVRDRQFESPYKRPEEAKGEEGEENGEAKEGKINSKWTTEELLLGVQGTFTEVGEKIELHNYFYYVPGVRKFGKNFKVISEILGNKTESHVRSFFVNYRRRY